MPRTKAVEETQNDLSKNDDSLGKANARPGVEELGLVLGNAAAGTASEPKPTVGPVAGGVVEDCDVPAVAYSLDSASELAYWEKNYCNQNYYEPNLPYSEYQPAFIITIDGFRPNGSFEDCEADLRQRWEMENPNRQLRWENARQVMQDAWHRLTGRCCSPDDSC